MPLRRAMSTISRQLQLEQSYNVIKHKVEQCVLEHKIPKAPRIVAVSKYKPSDDIKALYDLGQRHFGENYVQELVEKAKVLPEDIQWHFIGALQSNKCKVLAPIPNLYAIETLDSASKADKLNKFRLDLPKLHVYIQINTSAEAQKNGLIYSDIPAIVALANHIMTKCPNLALEGLMTIGSVTQSVTSDDHHLNQDFQRLVEVQKQVSAVIGRELELSMGMSTDYIEAIKQGSTNIRVGSSIFGARFNKEEMKHVIS